MKVRIIIVEASLLVLADEHVNADHTDTRRVERIVREWATEKV